MISFAGPFGADQCAQPDEHYLDHILLWLANLFVQSCTSIPNPSVETYVEYWPMGQSSLSNVTVETSPQRHTYDDVFKVNRHL